MSKYSKKLQISPRVVPMLLVIDMQVNFTNDSQLISIVENEIVDAIAAEQPVLLVKYRWCGDVHQVLTQAVALSDDLQSQFPVMKSDDNGASEILGTCRRRGIEIDHIRVCGVNTNACVEDTVLALASQLPNSLIEVLGYACRNSKTINDYTPFVRGNVVITKERSKLPAVLQGDTQR